MITKLSERTETSQDAMQYHELSFETSATCQLARAVDGIVPCILAIDDHDALADVPRCHCGCVIAAWIDGRHHEI
jgi:hypothetical protein